MEEKLEHIHRIGRKSRNKRNYLFREKNELEKLKQSKHNREQLGRNRRLKNEKSEVHERRGKKR